MFNNLNQKEYEKAIEYYQRALELELNNVILNQERSRCFYCIGECYLNLVYVILFIVFQKKYEEADKYFRTLLGYSFSNMEKYNNFVQIAQSYYNVVLYFKFLM